MPMYEYLCDDCGTEFEKLVRNGDTPECPSCGEHHLKQQYSTFAAKASRADTLRPAAPAACPSGMCSNPGMCGSNN